MDARRWSNLVAMQRSYSQGETRPRAGPREAFIEVAARCNLRCVMCPITVDPRYAPGNGRASLLAPELFERILTVAPTLQRAHLFGLGEPLLNPHLFDYAGRMTAAGVEVWTTTNATLIGPAEAERFADAGFARVAVSIDGATPETYERIRRRGRFEDVLRGLTALGRVRRRRGRPALTLSMVGMVSNLEEVPLLVELAAEVGADTVFVEELYGWEHPDLQEVYRRESLANLPSERVRELIGEGRRRATELGVLFNSRLEERSRRRTEAEDPLPVVGSEAATGPASPPPEPDGRSGRSEGGSDEGSDPLAPSGLPMPWPCSEPWSRVNVYASGEVRTCCFNDTVLGNLSESSLYEIWRGPAYTELRRHLGAGSSVASCDACVRAGRVERSPYLSPPVEGREPEAPPARFRLDAPAQGELVGHRLVVAGRLARGERWATGAGRRLLRRLVLRGVRGAYRLERRLLGPEGRRSLPEIYLDDHLLVRAPDRTILDGDRFAVDVSLGFVSEGSYELRVTAPAEAGGDVWARRTVLVGAPPDAGAPVAGSDRVSVTVALQRREGSPRLAVDGRRRSVSRWLCGPWTRSWRGVAVIDLDGIEPGLHRAELSFRASPPYRFSLRRLDPA